jgi:hypothetical protein
MAEKVVAELKDELNRGTGSPIVTGMWHGGMLVASRYLLLTLLLTRARAALAAVAMRARARAAAAASAKMRAIYNDP